MEHERTRRPYCLAHHVTLEDGKQRLMLASLRYLDRFVKMDGAWLFAERRLYVGWLEKRTFMPPINQIASIIAFAAPRGRQ